MSITTELWEEDDTFQKMMKNMRPEFRKEVAAKLIKIYKKQGAQSRVEYVRMRSTLFDDPVKVDDETKEQERKAQEQALLAGSDISLSTIASQPSQAGQQQMRDSTSDLHEHTVKATSENDLVDGQQQMSDSTSDLHEHTVKATSENDLVDGEIDHDTDDKKRDESGDEDSHNGDGEGHEDDVECEGVAAEPTDDFSDDSDVEMVDASVQYDKNDFLSPRGDDKVEAENISQGEDEKSLHIHIDAITKDQPSSRSNSVECANSSNSRQSTARSTAISLNMVQPTGNVPFKRGGSRAHSVKSDGALVRQTKKHEKKRRSGPPPPWIDDRGRTCTGIQLHRRKVPGGGSIHRNAWEEGNGNNTMKSTPLNQTTSEAVLLEKSLTTIDCDSGFTMHQKEKEFVQKWMKTTPQQQPTTIVGPVRMPYSQQRTLNKIVNAIHGNVHVSERKKKKQQETLITLVAGKPNFKF